MLRTLWSKQRFKQDCKIPISLALYFIYSISRRIVYFCDNDLRIWYPPIVYWFIYAEVIDKFLMIPSYFKIDIQVKRPLFRMLWRKMFKTTVIKYSTVLYGRPAACWESDRIAAWDVWPSPNAIHRHYLHIRQMLAYCIVK